MIDFYKKYLQKNPIFYLLLCFLYLEILLRFAIFHNIQLSFIYIFVFDMSFAIFISLITRIMKRKVNIIIFHILLFIICLYYCIQILKLSEIFLPMSVKFHRNIHFFIKFFLGKMKPF